MTTVPKQWLGETCVCIGSGPSLTLDDVAAVRGRARVIAINRSYEFAGWADAMYACDGKLWEWVKGAPTFHGLKYSIDPAAAKWLGVQVLRNDGPLGLCLDPTGLRTGKNSGYQALNLAVHFGAARVILLGYDMGTATDGRSHWHPDHPDRQMSPYPQMIDAFVSLIEPLAAIGVTVVNCSRRTALTAFPRAPLDTELARLERAA